jgi:hypothetical protein
MSGFDDYAANTLAGMKTGAGDVTRHMAADIGDTYQEILMSHASTSPPDGLTGTMETVTTSEPMTPNYTDASYTDVTPEPPALSAPEIDVE